MPGDGLLSWARRNLTESRLAAALVIGGAPTTLVGVLLYALSGPGFPVLVIGLAALVTGLVMLASRAGHG